MFWRRDSYLYIKTMFSQVVGNLKEIYEANLDTFLTN